MLSNYDIYFAKNFDKFKSRTRKGVPDSIRGLIWQLYAEVNKYRDDESLKDLYIKLVNDDNIDIETESVILRDIDRTFPKHTFFKEKYGLGQRSLFNVLRAYAKFNPATGYVQGMGFIAALLLTYMDEESTFWMIHSLIMKYNLKGFYMKDFPELKHSFYKLLCLLKKHIPLLYEHFRKHSVHPSMYACQWFISIFSVNFKFDILVRIFDVFLLEGEKILYRFALAILKLNEERLLKAKAFENIMALFKGMYEHITADDLINRAFKFSISRKQILVKFYFNS
jgi:hypothetical protein